MTTAVKVSENGISFAFAKTKTGEVVRASQADRCVQYFCCICNKKMILRSGEILSTHFAHEKNSKTCRVGKVDLPTSPGGPYGPLWNKYFKCQERLSSKVVKDYFPIMNRYEGKRVEFCYLSLRDRRIDWVPVEKIESMCIDTIKDKDGTEVKCIFFKTKPEKVRVNPFILTGRVEEPVYEDRFYIDVLLYCDEIAEAIKENTEFTLEETYDYEVPVNKLLPLICL